MSDQTKGTTGQHFVPSFYLENFTRDGHLCVYDRADKRFFVSTPEKMCKQRLLYETKWEFANPKLGKYVLYNQLENCFSVKETNWSVIIQKIIKLHENNCDKIPSGLVCSKTEKDDLAEFIACTFLRHPIQLKNTIDYYADSISGDSHLGLTNTIGELFNMWGWGSPKSLLEHSVKTMSFDPNIDGSPVKVLKSCIQQMNMFFICNNKCSFMTSSFPVLGIEGIYQQVFIPISPRIIICCSESPDTRNIRNRFNQVTEESADTLSAMYLAQSVEICRYLIAHDVSVINKAINMNI